MMWAIAWAVACGEHRRRRQQWNQPRQPAPPGPACPAHQEATVNSTRRLRRTLARRASSPSRAEPQARQPSRPGRDRLAARFSQSVAAGQDRPAAAPATGATRPDSGSAATAAGRRAAPGACPAASARTRAPITRSRPMVRTMRGQARRSRAGARLPRSPGAPSDPAAATGSPWPRLTAAPGAGTARRLRRWVIVAGIVLLAGSITATVTGRTLSPPAPQACCRVLAGSP